MANIDAQAGAARYAAKTTNRGGMCLWEVQVNGYQAPASIGPYAGQYPTAYTGWQHATQKHTDANPPRGAAVYFGPSPTRTDKNKNAGDVCISLGGGLIRCSDGAGAGRMATMTIAARARQIARPYLGWTSDFLGHQLVNLGAVVGVGSTATVITAAYVLAQLGVVYLTNLQKQLGVTADGKWGPQTAKALQTKVGTPADGVFGKNSNKALQTKLGITADGLWGAATTIGLKHAIDVGTFGPVVVTPPVVTPPAAYVPPTEAQYKALQAQLAAGTVALATATTKATALATTLASQQALAATLQGKVNAGQVAAAATVKALI